MAKWFDEDEDDEEEDDSMDEAPVMVEVNETVEDVMETYFPGALLEEMTSANPYMMLLAIAERREEMGLEESFEVEWSIMTIILDHADGFPAECDEDDEDDEDGDL